MAVFMLSLAGIPPTAGFVAKFYIFKGAMEAAESQLLWLVILGVLNSAISIFYYLRPVMAMYFRDPDGDCRQGHVTVTDNDGEPQAAALSAPVTRTNCAYSAMIGWIGL